MVCRKAVTFVENIFKLNCLIVTKILFVVKFTYNEMELEEKNRHKTPNLRKMKERIVGIRYLLSEFLEYGAAVHD